MPKIDPRIDWESEDEELDLPKVERIKRKKDTEQEIDKKEKKSRHNEDARRRKEFQESD